jgi:SP family general alpha glucoside:H+ symporter-like MFS transporter
VMGLAVTIIGAFALDYVGRRSCFLFAVAATWCCLITIGGLGLAPKPTSTAVNKFTLFVALGWSYVAETGSSRLRAKTAGFAAAGGVCIGLVFSTSVPYMLSAQYANWGLKTCFFCKSPRIRLC